MLHTSLSVIQQIKKIIHWLVFDIHVHDSSDERYDVPKQPIAVCIISVYKPLLGKWYRNIVCLKVIASCSNSKENRFISTF